MSQTVNVFPDGIMLYWYGNEFASTTGGWVNSGYSAGGWTIQPSTKNTNNLYCASNGEGTRSYFGTNNPVTLTNRTLHMKYTTSPSGYSGERRALSSKVVDGGTSIAEGSTGIRGSYYIGVWAQNGSATTRTMTLHYMYLE